MRETEYRVRPVTRWIVTRWHCEDYGAGSSGVEECGEFSNLRQANKVCEALGSLEPEAMVTPMPEEFYDEDHLRMPPEGA